MCTSMHTNVDMPRIISNSRGHVIWNQVKACHTLLLFRKVSRVPDTQYWSHMLHRTVLQMSTPCSASFPHSPSCGCTKLPEAYIRERSPLELQSDKDNCSPSLSSAEAPKEASLSLNLEHAHSFHPVLIRKEIVSHCASQLQCEIDESF